MWVKLLISSPQSRREVSEGRRLLVPTWITISSGFFRDIDLIWSLMSCIEKPGNEEIFTLAVPDILPPCRFFKIESSNMKTSLCLRCVVPAPSSVFVFVRAVSGWLADEFYACERLLLTFVSVEGRIESS